MSAHPTESASRGYSQYTILKCAWERTKQGASVRFFGIRLSLRLRKATPLPTNRWLLFRKRLARWVAGETSAPALGASSVSSGEPRSKPITGIAVVVGVGEGLGTSLVKHLSA